MYSARLKTRMWITAQVRACAVAALIATVVRRGDEDSGAVLIKQYRGAAGFVALVQTRVSDDEVVWLRGTGAVPVAEAVCDAFIERAVARDPDLWVLEIEDPDGRAPLGAKIV